MVQKIGKGAFGEVLRAQWHSTDVAVKKLSRDANKGELLNEIIIMQNVRHLHLVSLYAVVETQDEVWLVMELLPNGTLLNFIQNPTQAMDWNVARRMALDIAKGMNCLHHNKPNPIIHRDLKSLNVLMGENGVAKVADFGLGRSISTASLAVSTPEIILGEKYGLKADVYSFGIIMWELCARSLPYQDMNPLLVLSSIAQGARPSFPPQNTSCLECLMPILLGW